MWNMVDWKELLMIRFNLFSFDILSPSTYITETSDLLLGIINSFFFVKRNGDGFILNIKKNVYKGLQKGFKFKINETISQRKRLIK